MNGTLVATIRQRGQLTIPEKIRAKLDWAKDYSAVKIDIRRNEIVLKPYSDFNFSNEQWSQLWRDIKAVRKFKGKDGNLAGFIAQDRHNH